MKKIRQEKKYISHMISLYCKWGTDQREVCSACEELIEYIHEQIDRCPYGSKKRLCRSCQSSCFSDDMKQRFDEAIEVSKLGMIVAHPFLMLKLSLIEMKDNRQIRK